MRSAVRFRSVLLNSARPPLTPPVPRGASLLTPTAGCDVASPPPKPFNVHDLGTYPPYSTAAAREVLCALNACRGDHGELVTEETPKFKVFELMWKHNLAEDLHQYHRGMLRTLVPPTKEEDVRKYLNDMLNSLHFDPNSKLVERDEMVDSVCSFVSRALSGKLDKVTLASLCSTRGSGKTQLIKHCLFKAAADHVHGGAVMVVECGMPRFLFGDVMHMLNQRDASTLSEGDLHCFVVSLIRAHLKQRLGHELDEGVTTIAEAYAAWSRLLAGCSTPLIVFDSIESLPQTTGIDRRHAKGGGKRGFVEAIAFLLPSGHGLLVAGTLPVEALVISDPTNVCLWPLPQTRLSALTYEGYLEALVAWGRLSEKDRERATITTRILHYLCGGAPRLLWSKSHDLLSADVVTKIGPQWDVSQPPASEMPSAGDEQYVMWAMSALASGTRTPVCLEDAMPHLSGTKWGDATKGILFAVPGTEVESGFPRKREVVLQLPPVLAMVPDVKLALSNLGKVAQDKRIKVPSELKQWPKGLDVGFLHVAVESEEVRETTQNALLASSSSSAAVASSSCNSTMCVVEDDHDMAESSVSVSASASTSTAMLAFSAPLTSVGEETSSMALMAHYNLQPIGTQTKVNEQPFSSTCASSSSSSGLLCLQVLAGESAVTSSLSNLYIGADGKEPNEENVEQMPCSILPRIDLTGIQGGPEESEPSLALLSEEHFSAWIDLSAVVVHPSAASASGEKRALLLPVSAQSFVCNDEFGKEGSLRCYHYYHNNDLDYSCGEATCNEPLLVEHHNKLLELNDNNNNDSSDVDFNYRQNGDNTGERNRSHSSSVAAPASSCLTQLDECGDLLKVSYASSAYFPKEEIEGEAGEIDSYDDDDDDMHEDFVVYHHKHNPNLLTSDCLHSPPAVVDATPTTGTVPNEEEEAEEEEGANHRKAPDDFSEKNYPNQKRMCLCSRGIPEANCNEDENKPVALCLGSGASEEKTSLSRTSPYTTSKGNANSSASTTSSPSPSSFRPLPARLSVDLISSPASPVVKEKREVSNEQIHIGNLSLQDRRPRRDLVHTGPKNDNDDNDDHFVKGETCVFSLGQNGGLVAPTFSHVRRSEATGTMKRVCAVNLEEKDKDLNTASKEKGPEVFCRTEATRFRHSKQREQLRPSFEGCVIETAALESAPTPCPPRRQRTKRPDDNDIPMNDSSFFWGRDPQSGLFMRIEIGDGGLCSPKGFCSTSPLSAGEVTNPTAVSVFRCIVTPPPAAVLQVQSQPKPDGVAGTPLKFTSAQARTDSPTNVQKTATAAEAVTTRPTINEAPKEEEGGSAKQAKAEVGVEVGGAPTMVFADTFGSLAVEEIELEEEEIQSDVEESSENRLSDPQLHDDDEVRHVCGTVHHMTTSPEGWGSGAHQLRTL